MNAGGMRGSVTTVCGSWSGARWTVLGLPGFNSHTLATLVTERSDELALAMQLMRDRVPRVAMRYVKSDLLALLERYSPLP